MRLSSLIASLACAAGLAATVPAAQAANLIVNGDFSSGNTGFTSGYTLSNLTPQYFENGVHGIYQVLAIGSVSGEASYGDWNTVTTDPFGGNGKVFAADGATSAGTTVWQETVAVVPHTTYLFSYYAAEISNPNGSNAQFVATDNGLGNVSHTLSGQWQQFSLLVNSGNTISTTLALTDTNLSGPFNDFVLTDIRLDAQAVPEPATWALMLVGFGAIGAATRRRAHNSSQIATIG